MIAHLQHVTLETEIVTTRRRFAFCTLGNCQNCAKLVIFSKKTHRISSAILHAEDIDEFLEIKEKGNIRQILCKAGPGQKWTKSCLSMCLCLFFSAIKRLNDILKLGKNSEIEQFDKTMQIYYDRMKEKNDER